MKQLIFFAFGALLTIGAILIEKKKNIYVGKLPTSNFKRKLIELCKEEKSYMLIPALALLDMVWLWLFGYFLYS